MLKTFSIGGVHPHENKLSAHQPIIKAEIPAKAAILLGQHIGAPAKPIVAKGDVVKVGTKIAEPGGFVSAAIHSSVSGKVAKIDTIVDASGYAKPAIFIDVEGDEWEESIDRSETLVKECSLTSEEIVKKIADAGIVGLGGACFPTQVKLCPPPAFKAECVIINAVECEPYLTADHQLMLEHAEEIMVGVSILMKAVKVNKAFIGIENNKPDAIQLMTKVASSYAGIEVVPLKVKYPQGGEKQLIDAVIGRQVPAPPAIPINVGAVVQNVGTAYAVYHPSRSLYPQYPDPLCQGLWGARSCFSGISGVFIQPFRFGTDGAPGDPDGFISGSGPAASGHSEQGPPLQHDLLHPQLPCDRHL